MLELCVSVSTLSPEGGAGCSTESAQNAVPPPPALHPDTPMLVSL